MINLGNNIFLLKNNRLDNNTYLIKILDTLVVIDLSWNSNNVLNYLKEYNLEQIIFFFTHGHYDHIGEINNFAFMKNNILIYISEKEKNILLDLDSKSPFTYNLVSFKKQIRLYEDNESFILYDKKFVFIKTPGHSIGSMSIIFDNYIFTGDFLFVDCIGRIDLFTSSKEAMFKSCKYFNKNISDNFIICPGHGDIDKFKNIKTINSEFINTINYEK